MKQLVFALGLLTIAALGCMLIVPPLDGPDAPGHLQYAAFLAEGGGLVTLQKASEISYEMVQQPPLYYGLAALLDRTGLMSLALDYTATNPYIVDCIGLKTTVLLPNVPLAARAGFLIPRLLSLLGGLLAVSGCWFWLARALPTKDGRPAAPALTAALLLGLTPMFAFESAAITNDILTVGLAMWAIVAGMTAYDDGDAWQWLAAGMLAGCAALCKYSGLLTAVPLGVIWIWHLAKDRSWKSAEPALLMLAGFIATAGWWFARNMVLYGEIVPMETLLPLLPGLARAGSLSLAEFGELWGRVWRSFFGVYACGIAAPEWLVWGWAVLMRAGQGAVVLAAFRGFKQREWLVISSAAAWYAATLIMMTLWANSLQYTAQGRLLFISAPAQYALAAIGWHALIGRRQTWLRGVLVIWLVIGLVVTGIQLYDVYGPVDTLDAVETERPVKATLSNGIRIEGLELPDGASMATPGSLPVRVYVSAERPIEDFYTLYAQLVLADDTRVAAWHGLAADGRITTVEWPEGETLAAELVLKVDEPLDDLATLVVGAYPAGAPEKSEGLRLASVRLLDAPLQREDAEPTASLGTWQGGITLLSAQPLIDPQGAFEGARLVWGTEQPVSTDYTVSLQVLDTSGALIGQCDQQPGQGREPTSTWVPARQIEDTCLLANPVQSWAQLVVLLYDAQGQRLPIDGDDHLVIATP